ncbi:MAG: internal scaffolding protein [Microvirus sp.]|nr:MAG: internal scaffolding protein [Microvirus sp.]
MFPFLRTQFNYDRDEASFESALACQDPSRTVQDAAEDADINTIVRRFGLTGELPDGVAAPNYGDFTEVVDFHTAMIAVRKAEGTFMRMPAHVRARFENDPQLFLEFCSDERNRDEARKLGLLVPQEPLEPEVKTKD